MDAFQSKRHVTCTMIGWPLMEYVHATGMLSMIETLPITPPCHYILQPLTTLSIHSTALSYPHPHLHMFAKLIQMTINNYCHHLDQFR